MKVLLGNGVYDLCTPFFQTEYDINHLMLPKPLRRNVAFAYSRHMLYSSEASLAKFTTDLTRFLRVREPGLSVIDERPAAVVPSISL